MFIHIYIYICTEIYISWVFSPPSSSHPQDDCISTRDSQPLPPTIYYDTTQERATAGI